MYTDPLSCLNKSQKDVELLIRELWMISLSYAVMPHDIHGRLTRFLWKLFKYIYIYIYIYIYLTLPEIREDKINKGCWTPKILQTGNSVIKLLYCKHVLSSRRNKDNSEGGDSGPEDRTMGPEGRAMVLEEGIKCHRGFFSQALKHNRVSQLDC